jgi:hypothetical protein
VGTTIFIPLPRLTSDFVPKQVRIRIQTGQSGKTFHSALYFLTHEPDHQFVQVPGSHSDISMTTAGFLSTDLNADPEKWPRLQAGRQYFIGFHHDGTTARFTGVSDQQGMKFLSYAGGAHTPERLSVASTTLIEEEDIPLIYYLSREAAEIL